MPLPGDAARRVELPIRGVGREGDGAAHGWLCFTCVYTWHYRSAEAVANTSTIYPPAPLEVEVAAAAPRLSCVTLRGLITPALPSLLIASVGNARMVEGKYIGTAIVTPEPVAVPPK